MHTRTSVGVVIGRFQVASLHAGHRYLLDYVAARHDQLLILIGATEAFPTKKNPLSYVMREAMVRTAYPHAHIAPLYDHPSNEEWSKNLDALIAKTFPAANAVLYGSRDSFIPYYSGGNTVVEVPKIDAQSGTEYRRKTSKRILRSAAFRRGVIHTQENRFPIPYPAVDIAILNPARQEVLLGAKVSDGDKYRFIGGFVDTTDASLEQAALREAREETSLPTLANIRFVGSRVVDDWRYRGTGDVIMSTLFAATYVSGTPCPADDIAHLAWIPYDKLLAVLQPGHQAFGEMLTEHLTESARKTSVQPMLDDLEALRHR